MNFRSKLVAIAGSALIFASSITMGAAADPVDPTKANANASVAITTDPNVNILTVEISGGSFDPVEYSFESQDTDGELSVTVTDFRGTAPGWKVNLSADDFSTGGSSARTFPIGSLKLTPNAAAPVTGFSVATGITPSNQIVVSGSPQPILTAAQGAGNGKFTSVLNGKLTVPAGTLQGTYTAEVRVSIDAAP